jgi:hypothetical protein
VLYHLSHASNPVFHWVFFEIGSHEVFSWAGFEPDLFLLSSWDYRSESPAGKTFEKDYQELNLGLMTLR